MYKADELELKLFTIGKFVGKFEENLTLRHQGPNSEDENQSCEQQESPKEEPTQTSSTSLKRNAP